MTKPDLLAAAVQASQKLRMENTFANIKYLHSICEGTIKGLSSCPEKFHVDAEPEAVRLDIGNEFERMTADEAGALGTMLVMAAFKQQNRRGDFSCGPRLDPKWLKTFLEGLMRDWPKAD